MRGGGPRRPQVPPAYARWGELLRTLGVVDSPAPHHLLQLLAGVAAAAGGAPLNANERRAALRLLASLCDGDADAAQVGDPLEAILAIPATCRKSAYQS